MGGICQSGRVDVILQTLCPTFIGEYLPWGEVCGGGVNILGGERVNDLICTEGTGCCELMG